MRILVTFAVEAEFAPWRKFRYFRKVRINENHYTGGVDVFEATIGGCTVWVLFTGIGIKLFDFPIACCFRDAGVDAVVSSGLAGALRADYIVGDVVVPKKVGSLRDVGVVAATPALFEFAERKGATIVATLLTADHIIETSEEKSRIAIFGDAVDMESVHVMKRFSDENLPVITIRAISDVSDEDLPIDFTKTITADGRVKFVSLLKKLVGHPTKIPDLVRFGQQSKGAARKLAAFLDDFVGNLSPELLAQPVTGRSTHE